MTPVFGRERELALACAFLEDPDEGFGVLMFEGEAGIGKTTVWEAGVMRARELGFRVLEARPAAAESELSFVALGDLLAAVHDEIGSLPAPQRRALRIALVLEDAEGEPADHRTIAVAVLELLRRLAAEQPLLVGLDDLHWLDSPSASALQFALRRLDDERVRVLATSRPSSGSTVITFDNVERITVGPLPVQALGLLVRARLGARFLRPTLRQLQEASGGNPFYALEIAASVLRSGRPLEAGAPLPIPSTLRELVRDRLGALTPAAREAALATAALAQPTVDVVEGATSGGFGAVSEAVAAGVLDRDQETLRFTHPLLASTLYEDSPRAKRRELHRRLAEAVFDPEERARHLAEAATGPDEELAHALEAAAASVVARGAPDAGVRLARRALELTPPDRRSEAHRRRLDWARYTLAAGDPQRAETLLEDHLELAARGRESAEVEFELGKARWATRGSSAARACYQRALRELEGMEEPKLRTMILIELAGTDLDELRWDSDASERAVMLAGELGEPDLLARALGMHGLMFVFLGQPPPESYWRRAIEIEKETGELRFAGPMHAYCFAALLRGDGDAADEHAHQVAASMRRRGDPMLPAALLLLGANAREFGDWDAADRYTEEAHDLVVQTGLESLEPNCLRFRAQLALLRGDLDLTRRYAEEATNVVERLGSSGADRGSIQMQMQAAWLNAQIASTSGRHAEAHEWLAVAIEAAQRVGKFFEGLGGVAELLAADIECLLALGKQKEATRELEDLVEMTDALRVPFADGCAARAGGLVAAAAGDSAVAVRQFERALESFEAPLLLPYELAKTLYELGRVQRRARQKQTARRTLERALEIFERLGARLWAERTRAELGKIGGRPSHPGGLTTTEQSVADLVAAGRSNAEVARELFLSPKTVEWNLSKIYRKLHVRSRAELAAKLAKRAAVSR